MSRNNIVAKPGELHRCLPTLGPRLHSLWLKNNLLELDAASFQATGQFLKTLYLDGALTRVQEYRMLHSRLGW